MEDFLFPGVKQNKINLIGELKVKDLNQIKFQK